MKKRRFSSNKNQDLWITSYADLISAIFAVMVLFVSFSKIDLEKFDMVQKLMVEKKKWLPISYFLISLILAALPDKPRK